MNKRSFYLAMRDRTRIAVDVFLPKEAGMGTRVPAILSQTRYFRAYQFRWPFRLFLPDSLYTRIRKRFLRNGYAWVSVDVRGTGASFGQVKIAFSREQVEDAGEIVDWIVNQPWSDGQVGGYGASYDGICAELLLYLKHPAVRAVMPAYAPFDLYEDISFPGGLFLSWFYQSWGEANRIMDRNAVQEEKGLAWRLLLKGVAPVDADRDRSLLHQSVAEHHDNWDPYETLQGRTFRDEKVEVGGGYSIDDLSPHTRVDRAVRSRVPVFSCSGWFDAGYARAAVKRFLSSGDSLNWLTLGPWDHGGFHNDSPTVQRRSRFDHAGEALQFFDRSMKGKGTATKGEKRVRYYTMIEDRWKQSEVWPPAGTRMRPFYLAASRRLSLKRPGDSEEHDTYPADLSAGTGTRSRWRTLTLSVRGAGLYPDRKERDVKLFTYTSDPLEHDLEVSGHPLVHLYISADADDAALYVYLEDVYEKGRVTMVTEGQFRALHRKLSAEQVYGNLIPHRSYYKKDALPLIHGEVTELVFDIIPTSYVFRQGHAIRLALAGADQDHFGPLPGDPPEIHIHRNAAYPSRVELPVLQLK